MRCCPGANRELIDQSCSLHVYHDLKQFVCTLQNNPLYLEAFQNKGKQEDVLRFHYIVHCALDAIEEKGCSCYILS